MKKVVFTLGTWLCLALMAPGVGAQDYRGRVQGSVSDTSQATLPGVTVTLINDATGVSVIRVTDVQGRYVFDFVEPGVYTITSELQGFKPSRRTSGCHIAATSPPASNWKWAVWKKSWSSLVPRCRCSSTRAVTN